MMTNEKALIAEIHNLPQSKQAEAVDAALRLIKSLAKQSADDLGKQKDRKAGSGEGKYHIAPDFDEPLEDFEEYM
jgi:hypothetical protein